MEPEPPVPETGPSQSTVDEGGPGLPTAGEGGPSPATADEDGCLSLESGAPVSRLLFELRPWLTVRGGVGTVARGTVAREVVSVTPIIV